MATLSHARPGVPRALKDVTGFPLCSVMPFAVLHGVKMQNVGPVMGQGSGVDRPGQLACVSWQPSLNIGSSDWVGCGYTRGVAGRLS